MWLQKTIKDQSIGVFSFLLISLLCVGVILLMLGVSQTFWDLDGWGDTVESSVLESFAVVDSAPSLSALPSPVFISIGTLLMYRFLRQYQIFHPPLLIS